jgi:hypothetical protein
MNQINIIATDTPVLNIHQLPGYHTNDQILSQIGRFVVTVITDGNCNVVLPSAAAFRLGTANFFIADVTGAGGAITVTTADGSVINGQSSFVFNAPFQSATINLLNGEWFTAISGGGNAGVQLLEFDVTFSEAEIASMFANPDLGALEILGIPPANSAYDIITINAIPSGTPIVVASGSPIIQASTGVGAFPMFQTAETWANGASFAGLVPILFNPGMVVRELTGGTFVLCSDAAYSIIGSAFSLRVYGLYRIKSGLPF